MKEMNAICRIFTAIFAFFIIAAPLSAGGNSDDNQQTQTTILAAAAASLETAYKEIIPLFEASHPGVTVDGTYDSSGKLQAQIEQGLDADVFMSAATKQMDALVNKKLVDPSTVTPVLENKIVLIKTAGVDTTVTGFSTIADAENIALGDPASVPAGQYAQEALTNLGVWEAASAKASFGTNVTEVLAAVGEGSADVGIVYATDAARPDYRDKVQLIADAPPGSLKTAVVYPAGIVEGTAKRQAAEAFLTFLLSPEALAVFQKYGFTKAR
jgi:molybdate transport system substrate-binding protein